jgi:hypothetical protein
VLRRRQRCRAALSAAALVASLIGGASRAAADDGDAPRRVGAREQAPAATLAVQNPRRTGRRLLSLEDLVGTGTRRDPQRFLVVLALDAAGRAGPLDDAALGALADDVARRRGLMIGVLGPGVVRAGERLDAEARPFVVVSDPHGLARRPLALERPGTVVLVRIDGRVEARLPPERFAEVAAGIAKLGDEDGS